MTRLFLATALLLTGVAPAARAVGAESEPNVYLRAGIRLFSAREYEAALVQLAKAGAVSDNTPAEDVTIHLYEGMAQAELGRDEEALRAFKLAVSLSPEVPLPDAASPRARQLFDRVKRELAAVPSIPTEQGRTLPGGGPPTSTAVEGAARPVPPDAIARAAEAKRRRVVKIAPWAAMGLGVVLGIAGGIEGYSALDERRAAVKATFQSDAALHMNAAFADAQTANTLYVGAGVAAAVGVMLLLFGGHAEPVR